MELNPRPSLKVSLLVAGERQVEGDGRAYTARFVHLDACMLTAGVDVPGNHLAIRIDAWGEGEESWLVLYVEIHGTRQDRKDPVWDELSKIVLQPYSHGSGAQLPLFVFGARQTARGVTFRVRKDRGRQRLWHAFIATMASGHTGVFQRYGPKVRVIKGAYQGRQRIAEVKTTGVQEPGCAP